MKISVKLRVFVGIIETNKKDHRKNVSDYRNKQERSFLQKIIESSYVL